MATQSVTYAVEDGVATVTLSNPPANVLSTPVMLELERVFDELQAAASVKAIVLTGAGEQFIAGADVREIARITTRAQGEQITSGGHRVLQKVATGKPVVAAIQGWCLGGGLEVALACHLRVAGERARLGLPEIELGIMPGFGGTQRLARLVGLARAIELILTGDRITAQEAKAIGLVNRVVPDGEVLKQAQGLAKKIASRGQVAVRAALRAITEGTARPLEEGLRLESTLFGELCETHDKQEGLKAFLEKRQPRFEDR